MENPLNQEHCDCLNLVLQHAQQTADLITKCKACGFDMDKAEEENAAQIQLASALKQQFFPNQV